MYYRSFLAATYDTFWRSYQRLAAHARHCYEVCSVHSIVETETDSVTPKVFYSLSLIGSIYKAYIIGMKGQDKGLSGFPCPTDVQAAL